MKRTAMNGWIGGVLVALASVACKDPEAESARRPFAADVLTVSIPMPWPLQEAPVVILDGSVIEPVSQASDLRSESWLVRGSLVTVSIALQRNTARQIVIRPRGR